jgi:hypothetical protein
VENRVWWHAVEVPQLVGAHAQHGQDLGLDLSNGPPPRRRNDGVQFISPSQGPGGQFDQQTTIGGGYPGTSRFERGAKR